MIWQKEACLRLLGTSNAIPCVVLGCLISSVIEMTPFVLVIVLVILWFGHCFGHSLF